MNLSPHQSSEDFFRRAYEESPVAYHSLDTEGRIVDVNRAWLTLLGYNRREAVGHQIEDFLAPLAKAVFAEQFPRFRERGSIPGTEFEMLRKDGSVLTVAFDGVFVRDGAEHPRQSHCILHDVTQRKRAEQKLQMFQFATDQADDAVFWMDCHAGFYYVNDQACRSLGYTREELMRLRLFDIDPAYLEERWKADWAQFHEKRIEVQRLESFHRRKDGVVFPIEVVGKHCWFDNTELHVAYVRDITGRRRAEKTLRESEARYRTLFDKSTDGILIADIETKGFKYANPAMCRMLGYTEDELRTMSVPDIHPKDALQRIVAEFETQARVDNSSATNVPCLRKNGSVVHVDISGCRITVDGKPCNVGFFRDITERKRAEEELREAKDHLENIINSISDPIFVKDRRHRWVLLNDAHNRFFGRESKELIGKTDRDFFPQGEADEFWSKDELVFTTGLPNINEEEWTDAKGNIHTIATKKNLYTNGKGEKFIVGVIRDITGRKQAEAALQDSEARFRTLFERAPVAISISRGEKTIYVNQKYLDLYGYPNIDELVGRPVIDQWAPEFRELVLERARKRARGEPVPSEYEGVGLRKDGSPFPVHISVALVELPDGPAYMAFLTDITERKQSEEALQNSQALYQSLVENLPQRVYRKDRDGRFVFINEQSCRDLGLPLEEILGKTDADFFPPELAQAYRKDDLWVMETGQAVDKVEKHVEPDGREMFVHVVKTPLRDAQGQITGIQGIFWDVTERKRAEEAVKESRQMLQLVLDTIPVRVFWKDLAGRFEGCNHAFARDAGFDSPEALVGKDDHAMWWKDQADLYRADDDKVIASGDPKLLSEKSQTTPAGEQRWLLTSKVPLRNLEGRVIGVLGAYEDITERKQAGEKLRLRESFLSAITENQPGLLWLKDTEGRFLMVNKAFATACGRGDPEHVRGLTDMDIWPKELADKYRNDDQRVMSTGNASMVEEMIFIENRHVWYETFKTPVRDDKGRVIGTTGFARDITERKRAEEALANERVLLRTLVDHLPMAVYLKDLAGRKTLANRVELDYVNATSEAEVLGKTDFDLFPQKQAAGYHAIAQEIIRTGKPLINHESNFTKPDGSVIHVLGSIIPVHDTTGRVTGLAGINYDITERKQAEERIREQSALLDAANDAIYVRTLDHTVTYWNDGAERLYGWTRAEALGRKITDLGDRDHKAFEAAHAALLEQGSWSGELTKTSKSGKEHVVFCRWTLLRDEAGRPREVLAINTDITERKQLEVNFLRAQRMEGIGALAGGIAHDLNNILQPILMTAPLLRETTSDPENRGMLDTVESCAQRGADIIKQLLTFARGVPSTRVPLPVRHLMNEMSKLIQETFPRNIRLRVNASKDLWQVLGDATQIHQALMNLCVNARDAMPSGGTLTLTAENLILDDAFAAMMPGAKPGPHICVSVADTGMGIPPEHLGRIFDPFFTTKEIGKGTGLGLATVLGIAQGHGGFVRVNSQVGKGTTFEVYLPASPGAKAAVLSGRDTLPPRAGGELILVVDDEADVRAVVRRTLEKHGYQVMTAAEGAEAMGLFAKYQPEIRAVLTDMMMPNMDGPSLVRALRHLDRQLPILGMTGVGDKADIKELDTLDLLVLLTKPFNIAGLLDVLHRALAKPSK